MLEVKKEKLKFRPILDKTGTHTYNMAQVISTYLKPSFRNEYAIDDIEIFPKHIKDLHHYKKMTKMYPLI